MMNFERFFFSKFIRKLYLFLLASYQLKRTRAGIGKRGRIIQANTGKCTKHGKETALLPPRGRALIGFAEAPDSRR
jgi:hypothetical protein